MWSASSKERTDKVSALRVVQTMKLAQNDRAIARAELPNAFDPSMRFSIFILCKSEFPFFSRPLIFRKKKKKEKKRPIKYPSWTKPGSTLKYKGLIYDLAYLAL